MTISGRAREEIESGAGQFDDLSWAFAVVVEIEKWWAIIHDEEPSWEEFLASAKIK